jgi:chloride channel protein, CIC family
MTVEDLYEEKDHIPTISAGMPFSEVQKYLSNDDVDIWPVVKNDGTIVGILSLDTTKPILFETGVEDILIAQDMAIPAAHIHPDDSLYDALLEFLKYPVSEILVTDPDDENKILGLLHHRDLIRAYNNEIIERQGKD